MDVLFVVLVLLLAFGSGYAFRGFIGREIKAVVAEMKSLVARAEAAALKFETRVVTDVKTDVQKVISKL